VKKDEGAAEPRGAGTRLQSRLIYLIASPGLQPGFNASLSGRSRSVKTKREAGAKGARVGQMRGQVEGTGEAGPLSSRSHFVSARRRGCCSSEIP